METVCVPACLVAASVKFTFSDYYPDVVIDPTTELTDPVYLTVKSYVVTSKNVSLTIDVIAPDANNIDYST
jgi:hypothetical protein